MITFHLRVGREWLPNYTEKQTTFFPGRRVFLFDLPIRSTLNLIRCSGHVEAMFAEFLIAIRDVTRDVLQNK